MHNNIPYQNEKERKAAILAAKRKWYQKNKEKVKAYSRTYYANKKQKTDGRSIKMGGNATTIHIAGGQRGVRSKQQHYLPNTPKPISLSIPIPITTHKYTNQVFHKPIQRAPPLQRYSAPLTNNKPGPKSIKQNKSHKKHNKRHSKRHNRHHSKRHSRKYSKKHSRKHNKH